MKPVALLVGPESILIEDEWTQMRSQLAEKVDFDIDFSMFRGRDSSEREISAALSALPFVSDYRVVLVEEVDSLPAADQTKLASYLADPSPSHILVMTAKSLPARSALRVAAKESASLKEFALPKERGAAQAYIRKFVSREAARSEVDIDGSASSLLVDWTRGDLIKLRTEIRKLAVFCSGKRVTADDVRSAVSRDPETSVFALIDATMDGKIGDALALLRASIKSGEPPLKILALYYRQIKLLIGARELIDQGREDAIASELKVPPFVERKLKGQLRRLDIHELSRWYQVLVDTDAKIKSGRLDPDFAMEDAIFRLLRPEWG